MVNPNIAASFSAIEEFSALVIGDYLLDSYTKGDVRRISPEAPVPVLHVRSQETRPGGAGNVVLNLAALGGKVFAVGRIGQDPEGAELQQKLSAQGVNASALLVEPHYKTPLKMRLIGDGQQLLRVDREVIQPLSPCMEERFIEELERLVPNVQVIAVSDYGKGFLTDRILAAVIRMANAASIPVVVDPKGIHFEKYQGATLLKPNLSEAYAAAKLGTTASLDEVAQALLQTCHPQHLLITRSEAGMSLFSQDGKRIDFPVHSKEVKDVTGAGDTVLSMICLGLANQLDLDSTIQLANIAASISIERIGCIQVSLAEIAKRLLELNSENKIFQEDHSFALRQVLQGRRYSLLTLNETQQISHDLVRAIRRLARSPDRELLVTVKGNPDPEFLHLLSSLQEVSYILLQRSLEDNLFESIPPEQHLCV